MRRDGKSAIGNVLAVVAVTLLISAVVALAAGEAKNFGKSLHKSGAGMKYWYEQPGGSKTIVGKAYEEIGCSECHADNCKKCHQKGMKKGDTSDFAICQPCHVRQKMTFDMDTAAGQLDVHQAKGMFCAQCHKTDKYDDIHGNGTETKFLREPGAVSAKCTDCHQENQEIKSHKVHKGKLDCAACHINSSVVCANCHMDKYIETKKKEGNFIPGKSFNILINYEGKITSGTAMTLVADGKPFVAYTPYFTHSVQKQAKTCVECHGTDISKAIKNGEKVQMLKMEGDKPVFASGIIPCAPDQLEWTFFDKQGDKWVPLTVATPKAQMAGLGTPLTEKQIKMLAAPMK